MSNEMLVTVAPCIPRQLAANLPRVDVSPEGIAGEVVRAYNAGANVAHLHVWDKRGEPTTDLSAFERTLGLIREHCDIVIEGSTGGVSRLSREERAVCLATDVEAASLNVGSVNYDEGVYVNSPDDIRYWAMEMKIRRVRPDIAIFEVGMVSNSLHLANEGLLDPPFFFTFVLGQVGAMAATARNLMFLLEGLPEGSIWSVAGHGGHDLEMSALALSLGGNPRAGFEDNPFFRQGQLAKSNAELIDRVVQLGRILGREPAKPAEVRKLLDLRNHMDRTS
jgi:3-keto-5-aminohexanoate cleavage enzyme